MAGIEPHVAIRLKTTFPGVPKERTEFFYFPNTDVICADLDWFTNRYPMEMLETDRRRLKDARENFENKRYEIEQILTPGWLPADRHGFRDGRELYLYQKQAVEIVHRLKRLLLMDELGLGKTISALGVLAASPYLPAAIIVPSHLATQWAREAKKFTYLSTHIIKSRTPYSLPPANLYIFKYSNIIGWVDIAAKGIFRAVVFDEAQDLRRGEQALKGTAAKIFANNAEVKLAMTATPVYNYGSEIYEIVQYLEPNALGHREEFYREWCTWLGGEKWRVNDPDALGTYLREIQLALKREGTGEPVNTLPIEVEYDKEIERAEEDLARKLALTVLSGSFHERGVAARELDYRLRRVTGLAKAKQVAAYVRMHLEQGIPVLLSGWHRDVYAVWMKELGAYKPAFYTGTETAGVKDRSKERFVSGETDLMIISLRSGVGLDGLQRRCSTVIFGEFDWSPQVHTQVIGRLNRPGQKEKVTAIYLWANGGSDPVLIQVLGVKASQGRGITDPLKGVQQVYTDESRIKLLAKQYLEKTR